MKKLVLLFLILILFSSCAKYSLQSGKVVAKFTEPAYSYTYVGTYGVTTKVDNPITYYFCLQGKQDSKITTDIVEVTKEDYDTVLIDDFYITK